MKKYMFFIALITILGCKKDSLEDLSNEKIVNYSQTLDNYSISENGIYNVHVLSDTEFLILVQDREDFSLVNIKQVFKDDNWSIESSKIKDFGLGDIQFFTPYDNGYLIGSLMDDTSLNISQFDSLYNEINVQTTLSEYIDTAYNKIQKLDFKHISINENGDILIGGHIESFDTNYSCVVKLNKNLAPLWVKTYNRNYEVSDIIHTSQDTFIISHTNGISHEIIRDNSYGNAFLKFNIDDTNIQFSDYKTDTHTLFYSSMKNDIARNIRLNTLNGYTYVSEVEIYPVNNHVSKIIDRGNYISAGVEIDAGIKKLFISEVGDLGSIWCHIYNDENYKGVYDIVEMPRKGILILSQIERNSSFHLHLTRIDEEGALFLNEYTENCF